jgi:hypothetical protein
VRKCISTFVGALALITPAATAGAAQLIADFNDLTAGAISGKGGGTGFSGNWFGSAGGTVVTGDLTSPLYNVPQTGTAQRYRSVNATGLRQNYRTPAASPSGVVWFSFLAMAESAGDRAGVSINAPTPTPFNDPGNSYAFLVGNTLNFSFGAGTAGTAPATDPGSTVLVVGQVNVNGGAGNTDPVKLWLNPNLTATPDINLITPVYDSTATPVEWLTSIATLGLVAARADGGASGGGNVDNVRFSDGGGNANQAFLDVTSVPEPGTAAVLALASAAGLLNRRRRATA